jgi:hypothetical protein
MQDMKEEFNEDAKILKTKSNQNSRNEKVNKKVKHSNESLTKRLHPIQDRISGIFLKGRGIKIKIEDSILSEVSQAQQAKS